ncbi:MAG: hypothetical protein NC431_03830 [Firmicutes bacterium]|nr:hypothetical protein [Bacteroidales bacterium]MCM1205792.1 hypothetical protein [Bacillota bacterium]MCM1509965.1 hypothetical protein [Clostridium sp.]
MTKIQEIRNRIGKTNRHELQTLPEESRGELSPQTIEDLPAYQKVKSRGETPL